MLFRLLLLVVTSVTTLPALAASTVFSDRESVPAAYKWDLTRYYASWEAWEADLQLMEKQYDRLAGYKGKLAEGPETLLEALTLSDEAGILATRAFGYAFQSRDLNTRDNAVQARLRQLSDLYSRLSTQLSWMSPEILTIPESRMREWVETVPALRPYAFNLLDTYRTGQYTLDEAGERLLSLHAVVRGTARDVFQSLTDADGDRPEVVRADGQTVIVTPGTYRMALNAYAGARERRAVQKAWMEQYEDRRNTFASLYNGVLQQGWALARSRGYPGTVEMALDRNHIPVEVMEALFDSARSGAPEIQRYHRMRKAFMGLGEYGWSDMHASLVPSERAYPYREAASWVLDSVTPLGEEYARRMQEQLSGGFVDVYETPGKRSGAYNTSRYGVGSFVLLNYHGTLDDVFTLAHEMGHSLHSRLSQEFQPYSTHRYTVFVAEVASILNEGLLLDHLLDGMSDPRERLSLLEQRIMKIMSTFFLQSMMADYEFRAHRLVEAGEGITADRLTALWKETASVYFGEVIPEDDPYWHSWARIPHLFRTPFYVYQYATSLAAASAFKKRMQADPQSVKAYLDLLKSGGNDYPVEQLRAAGIEMTDPEVLRSVVEEFRFLLDRFEVEMGAYLNQTGIPG